jgi:DNA-binding response OmpR family regulator
VWSSGEGWQTPATVTEHVYRLRQKMEDDPGRPKRLTTVRAVGYRWVG